MKIHSAEFITSSADHTQCPDPEFPEYAFIGRSNVGKSSLINMLCERKKLAKISSTPGKTQLINHFLINENIYLVDLPGYGFAKVSKKEREKWEKMINNYLSQRPNLLYTFVLLDSRLPAQQIDLDFMAYLGKKQIPFVMLFTKIDKLSSSALNKNLAAYKKAMLKEWEALPQVITTSSESKIGREEVWNLIEQTNRDYSTSLH